MNKAIKVLENALIKERALLSCCLAEIKADDDAGLYGSMGQIELDYFDLILNCQNSVAVFEDAIKLLKYELDV